MIRWCVSVDEFEEADFPVVVGDGIDAVGGSVLESDVVGSSGKVHSVEAGDMNVLSVAADAPELSPLGAVHQYSGHEVPHPRHHFSRDPVADVHVLRVGQNHCPIEVAVVAPDVVGLGVEAGDLVEVYAGLGDGQVDGGQVNGLAARDGCQQQTQESSQQLLHEVFD